MSIVQTSLTTLNLNNVQEERMGKNMYKTQGMSYRNDKEYVEMRTNSATGNELSPGHIVLTSLRA